MNASVDTKARGDINFLVSGITNLPTPPIVFTQIQKVLNNPNTSAFDVAAILQEDAAMSAKVLKITNSAYYGLSREIESVRQAVVIIGMEAVKNLVLSASVFDMFSRQKIDHEFEDYFWRHSLATAFAARLLSRRMNANMSLDPEAGFSAGLLHDIGKMVIVVYLPDLYQKVISAKTQKPQSPDHAIESEVLGYSHSQIGAVLGEHWRLPAKLVGAISSHHDPQTIPEDGNGLPCLVHLANYLATLTFDFDPEEKGAYIEPTRPGTLAAFDMTEGDIAAFVPCLQEEYLKAETFISMAKGLG